MNGRLLMLVLLAVAVAIAGCRRDAPSAAEKALAMPIVPQGFNEKQLATLKCPENGSALRFATRGELDDVNVRIGAGKIKRWNSEPQTDPVDALLIRADGKIAYRLDGVLPDLKIEEALVLDDRVGHPDPAKHRK